MKEEVQGFKRVPSAQGGQVDGWRGGGGRVRGMHGGGGYGAVRYIMDLQHGLGRRSGQFIKTSPQDPPLVEVQVKVL